MNCDEVRAQYLAGEDDDATGVHLAECAACRARREDLQAGRRALMDQAIWEEPPPELEDQVVALITANQNRPSLGTGWLERWVRPLAAAAVVVAVVGLYGVFRTPSPDWAVAMPGTDLAPLATSTIAGWNTESGTRMVLAVEGLDPAPAGYVYELWLSQGPLHISAGTFTADGEIDLWTGVTRADFPRLWVTLEPLDHDESPSGHTVLDTGA
ncbi:MAG: anti-sigma factor [Acidimicrobiia bacterium]|nr:anti-sigma factor [Acidimicrobiia bacterium]MDH5615769.1 anti-sigma factor [Acidimicrobiia bacterium]